MKDERLLFTGYVTDPEELKSLYHHCYAYFHGHEYGGTNPAMLKALGYGCAILALDTRFNQEMLQNGKHGWYFAKTAASVTDTIHRAEASPDILSEFRSTAHEGLTTRYQWDTVAEQYLDVFRALGKRIKKV
jgi:glycosyltransferase involved in cell wall biosynthesis